MGSIHPDSDRLYIRLESRRRFWAITVAGSELYTRYGRVGSDGRMSRRRVFSTPQAAREEAEKRIAVKRKEGYRAIDGLDRAQPAVARSGPVGHVHAYEPALVAAILDAPDDEDSYLVYADWLQSQGDPRGELIALHHAEQRKPHDARIKRAMQSFEREHGRLLPARLVEVIGTEPTTAGPIAGQCAVQWRLGFVHRAWIGRRSDNRPYTVRELVAALLAHPSALFLRELVIGPLGTGRARDYRPVIDAICDAAPAALCELTIADVPIGYTELAPVELGDVSRLVASLPQLQALRLRGGAIALDEVDAPALRTFDVITPEFDGEFLDAVDRSVGRSLRNSPGARHAAGADQIAGRGWPRLAELHLCGNDGELRLDALPTVLEGRAVPALRKLFLVRTTSTIAIWNALAASPLLEQLDSVDLSHGDLSDQHVGHMLSQRSAFSHLQELRLDGNYLSRAVRADLQRLCGNVSIADQRGVAADLPPITDHDIIDNAPDARSYMAAGDVAANPTAWLRLGVWVTVIWGRYRGSNGDYDVFVDGATLHDEPVDAGCTCPSSKYPCKHVLGLLRLWVARGRDHRRAIPVAEPLPGFIDRCRASRYDSI